MDIVWSGNMLLHRRGVAHAKPEPRSFVPCHRLFFCLFATITLAKMVRDNRDEQVDTSAWVLTVWVGFFVAFVLTAWGLYRMSIGSWERGFMIVSWLFLVSSAFVLAKTVRDKQEADLMEVASRLESHAPPRTEAK